MPVQLAALNVDAANIANWQRAGGKAGKAPKSLLDQLIKPKARGLTTGEIEDFDTWYAQRFANN